MSKERVDSPHIKIQNKLLLKTISQLSKNTEYLSHVFLICNIFKFPINGPKMLFFGMIPINLAYKLTKITEFDPNMKVL